MSHPISEGGCAETGPAHASSRLLAPANGLIVALGRAGEFKLKNKASVSFDSQQEFRLHSIDPNVPGTSVTKTLVAVVLHDGNTTVVGHYTACVRHAESQVWWKYDDEQVKQVTWNYVKKQTTRVYLLFYAPTGRFIQFYFICND